MSWKTANRPSCSAAAARPLADARLDLNRHVVTLDDLAAFFEPAPHAPV